MTLTELTLSEAKEKLAHKDISSEELVKACFEKIEKYDESIGAFLTLNKENALKKAQEIDQKGSYEGILEGIPFAIKDAINTKGLRTTAGSKILENFVSPYNATVIDKIEAEGAIIIGKTNMDEFGFGTSNENSGYFPVKNPWDTSRVAGGSSGGSVAAVASGMCTATLGEDTGGSIRMPSALCGTVGLKPSYGRVSRFGIIPFASSLDQVSPAAQTVQDVATIMEVISGADPYDATTIPSPAPQYQDGLHQGVKRMKVGIPREYFEEGGLEPENEKTIQQGIRLLEKQGAKIQDISLPHTKYGVTAYYLIAPSEVSANLARYDGIRFGNAPEKGEIEKLEDIYFKTKSKGFGPEAKRRIMLGTFALSAGYQDQYYLKAQRVRTLIKQDFERAFEEVDIIATPVSPTTAWKLGEKVDDPLKMYLTDVYTIPASLAGICGVSVPVGKANNLPVGLQILGPQLGEQTILTAAYALEQEIQFYKQKPPL